MSVTVTVVLEKCGECRHKDHSGAFTPGGAKPVCGHDDACKKRGYDWKDRVLPYTAGETITGSSVRTGTGTIPGWCPLRSGSGY